jgi:FemAB-related protein (PEP-CTERM system-associated)
MKQEPMELLRSAASRDAPAVREATLADAPAWERFVTACDEATFFHRFGWMRIFERMLGHRTHYLLAEAQGQIVGVLPLVCVRSRLFGRYLASLPFLAYGGAACGPEQARAPLHRAAAALAVELRVDYLELRNLQAREPGWPRQDLYCTFRRAILPEVEQNLQAIPRKQRAMIRKGINAGLRSELDTDVSNFFALYADNMHRHGTPALGRRFFEALRAEFGRQCEVLTVFDARGVPVSSVLSFYFRDEVLPYYAGDCVAARDAAANDFKYWELMRRACQRGCRVFDYGRSKRGTGSFAFKKNWGFEPVPLHYEYRLITRDSVPQTNPMNPKYRALIALWRRLPLGVANALGSRIVRHLG